MLLEEPHSVLLTLSSKAVQFRSLMLRGSIRLSSPRPRRRCDERWLSLPPSLLPQQRPRVDGACGGSSKRRERRATHLERLFDGSRTGVTLRRVRRHGRKKAAMAVLILQRDLRVPIRDVAGSNIAHDSNVRRVYLRTGLADRDGMEHMVNVARALNPPSPGTTLSIGVPPPVGVIAPAAPMRVRPEGAPRPPPGPASTTSVDVSTYSELSLRARRLSRGRGRPRSSVRPRHSFECRAYLVGLLRSPN
jgi:hypothetical protein